MVLLSKVVNSQSFKDEVYFHKYKDKYQFHDTILSNGKVYDWFMSGNQRSEGSDYELDVDLTIYQSKGNTIGYTYPSTVRTWINRKFFSTYTDAHIAGNLAHEYCHKLGFSHSYYPRPSRKYSVPYAIGNIVRKLAGQL